MTPAGFVMLYIISLTFIVLLYNEYIFSVEDLPLL